MNNDDKKNNPSKTADENSSEGIRELDESELEDVAGGIAWHGRLDNRQPSPRWERRDDW